MYMLEPHGGFVAEQLVAQLCLDSEVLLKYTLYGISWSSSLDHAARSSTTAVFTWEGALRLHQEWANFDWWGHIWC